MAGVSGGVHEAGKTIDKTESLFSQERDPRFAEMYSAISGCKLHLTPRRALVLVSPALTRLFVRSNREEDDGSVLHRWRTADLLPEFSVPAGTLWEELQVKPLTRQNQNQCQSPTFTSCVCCSVPLWSMFLESTTSNHQVPPPRTWLRSPDS